MKKHLSILSIPAFEDNYLWIIHDGCHAVAVDPGDAAPVQAALAAHRLTLCAILLTHHHGDHTGGVAALLAHGAVPVYGPANDGIALLTQPLHGGQTVEIEQPALCLEVIDVPGHTRGHIAYFAPDQHSLFCGDTLFGGGCGRLFEGTAAQMLASLDRLAALPDDTAVYCAHEYTLANLRFAHEVEPGNGALAERIVHAQDLRARGLPTVPSTIALEKQTNPFLRSRTPAVTARLVACGKIAAGQDDAACFAALREWKNNFR